MGVLFASTLAVVAMEYLLRYRCLARFGELNTIALGAVRTVCSPDMPDEIKRVALLRHARDLAGRAVVAGFMLIGCALLVIVPAFVLDWWLTPRPSTVEALSSVTGWCGMIAACTAYAFVRARVAHV